MLPTEAFSEVIAFLRLFDLKSLAVGNSLCSSLAVKASKMIRWEDLSGLRFHIYNKRFEVYRPTDAANKDDECGWQIVAFLTIANEKETTEFIDTAFPNCIFEDVGTTYFVSEQLLDAVGRVADAVVVKGVLSIDVLKRPDDSLSLVRKFRKVKVSFLGYRIFQLKHPGGAFFTPPPARPPGEAPGIPIP